MKKKIVSLFLLIFCFCMICCGCKDNKAQVEQTDAAAEPVVTEVSAETNDDVEQTKKAETIEVKFKDANKKMWVSAGCNVRAKANKNSKKLGRLDKGDKVTVIGVGVNKCKNWYKIKFNGKTAYVSKKFLTKNKVEKPVANNNTDSSNNDNTQSSSSSGTSNKKPSSGSNKVTVKDDGIDIGDAPSRGPSSTAGQGVVSGVGSADDPDAVDRSDWE